MKIGFISAKGGQGVTTVSSILATYLAKSTTVTLVPSDDTRACLGVAEGQDEVIPNLRLADDAPDGDGITILDNRAGDYTVLVTRACYLALRRAVAAGLEFDGIVMVDEPGRALNARDVERALGKPVVAIVAFDPVIARAIDAGLLAARLPMAAARAMEALTEELGLSTPVA